MKKPAEVFPGAGWFAVKGQLQRLTQFFIDFGLRDAISKFQRHHHALGKW